MVEAFGFGPNAECPMHPDCRAEWSASAWVCYKHMYVSADWQLNHVYHTDIEYLAFSSSLPISPISLALFALPI